MEWAQLIAAVAAPALMLFVLGAPLAFALRLRGAVAIFVGLAGALATVALSSLVLPFFGMKWSLLGPLVFSLAISFALFGIRKYFYTQSKRKHTAGNTRWLFLGTLLAAITLTLVFIAHLPRPDAVAQTYDAIFHLNAARYVLDTGSASPFDMDLAHPGGSVFYPTLWHALVSLTVQVTGLSIPYATNGMVILTIALIWPIGVISMGRAVGGPSKTTTLVSASSATLFPNFPLIFTGYGTLYPNLLSMALIPYVVLALMKLFNISRSQNTDSLSTPVTWLFFFATLGAATLAHPNALHVSLMFAVPFAIWNVVRQVQLQTVSSLGKKPGSALILLLLLGVGIGTWFIGQTTTNPWQGMHGPQGAFIDALGTTPHIPGHNSAISVLLILGLILATTRYYSRPFVLVYIVGLLFYVAADGFLTSEWRTALLSPWYSDPWRLSAVLAIVMIPPVIIALSTLSRLLLPAIKRQLHYFQITTTQLGKIIVLLGISFTIIAIGFDNSQHARGMLSYSYDATEDSARVLTGNERQLLEDLPDFVEPDATVITNPWNGSSLAYALSGIQVLQPHAGGSYPEINNEVMDGITVGASSACDAAQQINARYVIDFGEDYVFRDKDVGPYLSQISGISHHPALTEVHRVGEAVLYKISGC